MLDRAVAEFRGVGYGEYVVRALVERVHFAAVTGDADDYRQALEDLRQAGVEVGRGERDVLAADLHLFRALLELVHLPPRAGSDRTRQ